jgi:hypothetical protein
MPLKALVVALVVLVLLLVALAILKKFGFQSSDGASKWPYYIRKPLTELHQVLYHRLVAALPDHMILAQVKVSRVLGVEDGYSAFVWGGKIERLTFDFVVCGKDAAVIAAIELDDDPEAAHLSTAADDKKNRAAADADLRLIRWNVRELPDLEAIRKEFMPRLLARQNPSDPSNSRA